MDSTTFDRLTRVLAAVPSRRAIGGAVLGSLAGLLGAALPEDTIAHNLRKQCRKRTFKTKKQRAKCLKRAKKHSRLHRRRRRQNGPTPECTTDDECLHLQPPEPTCTQAICDDGSCDIAPRQPGHVCRADSEPCDVAETCDGVSLDCPEDAKAAPGAVCDEGNPCTVGTCVDGGVCNTSPLAPGTPCPDGVCDGAGTCNVSACGDAICDASLENCESCPEDCGLCEP